MPVLCPPVEGGHRGNQLRKESSGLPRPLSLPWISGCHQRNPGLESTQHIFQDNGEVEIALGCWEEVGQLSFGSRGIVCFKLFDGSFHFLDTVN